VGNIARYIIGTYMCVSIDAFAAPVVPAQGQQRRGSGTKMSPTYQM
jgi:hypothetical protein